MPSIQGTEVWGQFAFLGLELSMFRDAENLQPPLKSMAASDTHCETQAQNIYVQLVGEGSILYMIRLIHQCTRGEQQNQNQEGLDLGFISLEPPTFQESVSINGLIPGTSLIRTSTS